MKITHARIVLPFFLALLTVCMPHSSEEQPQSTATPELLAQAILRLQQEAPLKHAAFSVYALDADSGKVLADYQSHLSLATGSTLKAITTATALSVLGADFRFQTAVGHTGTIAQGVLQGDLYIRGGGDPTLSLEAVEKWADALQKRGIKEIKGKIIGDASIFEPDLIPRTWIWEDIGNYYGAGACGLSINKNSYKLFFKTGKPGALAQLLHMEPEVPGLAFTNELLAGESGSGDNGYIFGAPFTYERRVRGTIPPWKEAYDIEGALPDPALFCAHWLQLALQKKGIKASGIAAQYEGAMPGIDTLLVEASAPLSAIVDETNTKSVNTHAEAMLKAIALRTAGTGSTAAGAKAIMDFWAKKGVEMDGFMMEDGSGLSRFNALTAKQFALILKGLTKDPIFPNFYGSLAIAGQTGTLKNLCRGKPAQGRVYAKSGYINRVRCYVGYANTLAGKRIAFAIMVNNFSGENKAITPYFEELFNLLVQMP